MTTETDAAASRPRRVWPWIAGIVGGLALIVVAAFAAESIARDVTTSTVQDQVVSEFGLPADQEVDVEITGLVLPQLIAGTLSDISISSANVPVGPVAGDIQVDLVDVPVRGDAPMGNSSGTLALSEDQVRALMETSTDFPADTLGLSSPNVTVTLALSLFGNDLEFGLALTPTASEGELHLAPAAISIGGSEVTADEFASRFGSLADGLLEGWSVCIAEYLPAAITVTNVEVTGEELVASFSIDGRISQDAALQDLGTCD